MKRYTKIISMTGFYYTKEFVKKGTKKNKIREISESTVKKSFLDGDTEVLVYFLETDKELLITPFSDDSDIKKYLGPKFVQR